MRLKYFLFFALFSFVWISCGDSSSAGIDVSSTTGRSTDSSKPAASVDGSAANTEVKTTAPAQVVRDKHDCVLMGKAMEDNQYWLAEKELLLAIVADTAKRYDKDYPESHRSFQIYDTKICDLIGNHVMPVNKEPDYPYYLFPNTYESLNNVICAQGGDFVYCFDVKRKEMMLPMIPQYINKRKVLDANSGVPQGLTIWDSYLFGYAADFGAYAFDIANKKQVENIMPTAEFLRLDAGTMNQLFMKEMSPGKFQAVLSSFDADRGEDAFQVKPLFKNPLPINSRLSANAKNNNLLVFKYRDGSNAIGVDMEKGMLIDIPASEATKSVQDILKWIKKQ